MPNLYNNQNLIEHAIETYATYCKRDGLPVPDEQSFVGGFVACFGILTGRVDIGLDKDAPLTRIFEMIHKDIHSFGQKAMEAQLRQEKFDKAMEAAKASWKNGGKD